jgi:hypothetical protein
MKPAASESAILGNRPKAVITVAIGLAFCSIARRAGVSVQSLRSTAEKPRLNVEFMLGFA